MSCTWLYLSSPLRSCEAAAQEEQLQQVARVQRGRIGRDHAEDRLHEAAHLQHGFAELFVGLGVELASGARISRMVLPWSLTRHR